ncbi:MAG: hypothetical protein SGI97_05365 [candidate division Zixibacteria bacterium]|nr:hypothetical protein [candidate division Zixibacteria bacterium]
MAKKQSFADKASKKSLHSTCSVCKTDILFVKHVKALKADNGAWKFRAVNTGVCKCNEKEIYA